MYAKAILTIGLLLIVSGCAAQKKQQQTTNLNEQLTTICQDFFKKLEGKGAKAQSYYTYFIPESEVNARHLVKFRKNLEVQLDKNSHESSLYLHPAPESVFFLSRYAEGVDFDKMQFPSDDEAALLASNFKRGTPAGWTAINTVWQQFKRLTIGDKNFIASLPDSVRTDVGKPLVYILEVTISLEQSPSLLQHEHSIFFRMLEVQSGQTLLNETYPLHLSYKLK